MRKDHMSKTNSYFSFEYLIWKCKILKSNSNHTFYLFYFILWLTLRSFGVFFLPTFSSSSVVFQPQGVATFPKTRWTLKLVLSMWPVGLVYANQRRGRRLLLLKTLDPAGTQRESQQHTVAVGHHSGYCGTTSRSDVQYDFWRNQWR